MGMSAALPSSSVMRWTVKPLPLTVTTTPAMGEDWRAPKA